METFRYNEHSIRYLRAGSGKPVILLHNGGTSHAIWKDVLPLLAGYEFFAPDLLGFGESSKPGKGYELDEHVAILSAFIEEHRLAPAFLVGNCMGSATSLAYAMKQPEKVRAMVLINTLTARTFENGLYSAMYTLPQRTPRLISAISKIPLGTRLGAFGVRSQLGRLGVARKVHARRELAAGYASAAQSRALLEVLADIPVRYSALDEFVPPADFPPICTLWGLENRVLPARDGRALVDTLKPARQEWLDGCGHLPMLDDPARVAAIIDEFLAAAPSAHPTATA